MGKAKDRKIWALIALVLVIAFIPNMAMALAMLSVGAIGHSEMSHIWVPQEEDHIIVPETAPMAIPKEPKINFHQILKGVCLRE